MSNIWPQLLYGLASLYLIAPNVATDKDKFYKYSCQPSPSSPYYYPPHYYYKLPRFFYDKSSPLLSHSLPLTCVYKSPLSPSYVYKFPPLPPSLSSLSSLPLYIYKSLTPSPSPPFYYVYKSPPSLSSSSSPPYVYKCPPPSSPSPSPPYIYKSPYSSSPSPPSLYI